MNKELRNKRKALNDKYMDFSIEVLRYIQSFDISREVYNFYRDQVIEDLYDAQQEGNAPVTIYKHGYQNYFQKKLKNVPKKNFLEAMGQFIFVFFLMFFLLSIAIYVIRFIPSMQSDLFKSEGIYLFVSADNLGFMSIYGFAGVLVSTFLMKGDKRRKYIHLAIVAGAAIVTIGGLFAINSIYSAPLKINMIVLFICFGLFSLFGFFLERKVSQKRCKTYLEAKNNEKE